MEKLLLISCLATAGYAIFFPLINLPNRKQPMMNICIYSVNPTRYQPKCFMCPSTAYPNVLRTCVNAAAIPTNVSFTQASCIEQNCMINRNIGKRSVDDRQEQNLLEDYHSENTPILLQQDNKMVRQKGEKKTKETASDIIGTEELFASENADYGEEEYTEKEE